MKVMVTSIWLPILQFYAWLHDKKQPSTSKLPKTKLNSLVSRGSLHITTEHILPLCDRNAKQSKHVDQTSVPNVLANPLTIDISQKYYNVTSVEMNKTLKRILQRL